MIKKSFILSKNLSVSQSEVIKFSKVRLNSIMWLRPNLIFYSRGRLI